ncbi:hypothetical protein G9A89_014372 [Geosiphon pyriformis]|nr:hypothetical protein G9A89_014372 [Geosiphon pyriformis]
MLSDHSSYEKALFQYFQKDLGISAETTYAETTTTRAIAETLHIIDTDIKYYMTQQFSQVQQPVESDPEEYENKSNNPITAQAKSIVNKKPRVLSPTTPSYHQTPQTQNLAESASPLMEKTAILQPIGSSDKEKQPALAPGEHSNTQTPIPLNITSNTLPINRIMTYQNIAKLEKFSGKEDNAYFWIMNTKKAITAVTQVEKPIQSYEET